MTHGSLFSGIGGFDLASEWMGWENKFHCEWNEFGQKVLKHYWSKSESYGDITKTDFTIWNGRIDILTGGFPCQPYSQAGKRLGKEDERHLWPEMLRAIREIQPRWVVGENVFGLINWNDGMVFDEVQADLEAEGYEVQPYVLPAVAVNAPHRRDRVWFVAHKHSAGLQETGAEQQATRLEQHGELGWPIANTDNDGHESRNGNRKGGSCGESGSSGIRQGLLHKTKPHGASGIASDPNRNGLDKRNSGHEVEPSQRRIYALGDIGSGNRHGVTTDTISGGGRQNEWGENGEPNECDKIGKTRTWDGFPTQSPVCGGDDGLPTELDGITFSKWRNESVKAFGNAIVPQVAYQIFKSIEAYEKIISQSA